jgi:hypothetical protein
LVATAAFISLANLASNLSIFAAEGACSCAQGMDSAQFQGITMAAFFAFSHDRFRLRRATDLQSFYSVPTRGQIRSAKESARLKTS